jgi:hypothetical protein
MRPVPAWRPWVELCGALVILFLAVWTRWPVPARAMLGLSVAMPELAHWLLALGCVIAAVAVRDWSDRRAKLAIIAVCPALLLAGAVLVRIPTAVRTFDDVFRSTLGAEYDRRIPDAVRERMRPGPLALRDLFLGLDGDGVTVTPGIKYAVQEGEPVALTVYRPADTARLPVVVQLHGGNWPRAYAGFDGPITRALRGGS